MFAKERQAEVLKVLHARRRVEVADLALTFAVSEDTVRRDLQALAREGHLQRTHGGAVALDPTRMPYDARASVAGAAKSAIAARAAELVEPGQTLFLDAGSTVAALAVTIQARPLHVITNSLDIAQLLADDDEVELLLTGGRLDRPSRYLSGPLAVAGITAHRAAWAVLGACAVHHAAGATSIDPADAEMKRAMAAASLRTMVLADATKFDTVAPHLVLPPAAIDTLVTDQRADRDTWAAQGVEVLTVPEA
jgi:DeoR/GlpR family transcriptional regulator of sugar metabolism